MPRSSRHKSHRERKHSSKDNRECSVSEDDVKVKDRNGKGEGSVRVSRVLTSVEKRKVASKSRAGNGVSVHGNGDVLEEDVKMKDRSGKEEDSLRVSSSGEKLKVASQSRDSNDLCGHSIGDVLEEDVKTKDRSGKEEGSDRVYRDSKSVEKRKVASQLRDGNDLCGRGNADVVEEHFVSKRRKEKAAAAASGDRWNGSGDQRGDGTTADRAAKGEFIKIEVDKSLKSKGLGDLVSKTSRRHDNVSENGEDMSLKELADGTTGKEVKGESFKLESYKSSKSKGSSDLKTTTRDDGVTTDKEAKAESFKLDPVKSSKDSSDLKSRTRFDGITSEKEAKGESIKLESGKSSKGSSDLKSKSRGDGTKNHKEAKVESFKPQSDKSFKSKGSSDLKSKSSRMHDTVGENEEDMPLKAEKGDGKNGTEVDLKRKSEKDSRRKEGRQWKDSKGLEESERDLGGERKIQDTKQDGEAWAAKKQGLQSADLGKERLGKQDRENTVGVQDELQNPDLEKELEKQIGKRRDGSSEKDKYQDRANEFDDRRLSSRGDPLKDDRYGDEKHKDESHGDKVRDESKRENRHGDDKYREDDDIDNRYGDDKYWGDGKRDDRHRDDKYQEDGDRNIRQKGDKYRKEADRSNRHRDDKYREEADRGNRHTDDKYREEADRGNRHSDEKYLGEGERDNRHRGDKYREEGDRDKRHRDDKYREEGDRDKRHRDDKYGKHSEREDRHREDTHQEFVDRENRHRVGKQRDDSDRDQRVRDVQFRDERTSRNRTSDKSDSKHGRDDRNARDFCSRKSSNCDGNPIYDDHSTKYNYDKGMRRANDSKAKEDYGDVRYRRTNEQRNNEEKKDLIHGDRERSYSQHVDMENSLIRSSPSVISHAANDHCRLPKHEGSNYRDYVHEERVWHEVTSTKEYTCVAAASEKASVSYSGQNHFPKDGGHLGELPVENHWKSVSLASSLQQVDKSLSPSSTDCKHLNKSETRRSLDFEETVRRSGGSRDAKDYSDKKGSRELPMDTLPVYERNQRDGDISSVSSPFSRNSRFPENSKSLLPPPPPFRSGLDNPLAFSSSENDSRGKSINRHRRIGDANMGRMQGSGWKGVPNWPSPVSNGFIPFQHGPPHVGFHPLMHHFRTPPMFGVRPSMELHHSGVPYHIADADRFLGHGQTLGWQNPVDDLCPPPLHSWDANNAVFGRQDWDNNRTLNTGRGWETSGDMWKVQNGDLGTELLTAPVKENGSAGGTADDILMGESGQKACNEQNQPGLNTENFEINQSSVAVVTNTLEAPQALHEENPRISKLSTKKDDHFWHVYLSKLDISSDLTQPELYDQYTSLVDMDHDTNSERDNSKILRVEEVMGAKVTISSKTKSTSFSAAISDSVFQKAMSLYMKQREEIGVMKGEKVLISKVEKLKSVPTCDQEKVGSSDDNPREPDLDCDPQYGEDSVANIVSGKVELPNTFVKLEVSPAKTNQKEDEPVEPDNSNKSEPHSNLRKLQMEEVDPVCNEEMLEYSVKDKSLSPVLEQADAQSPGKAEDYRSNLSSNKIEELKLVVTEACEAVMPVESGSVNLSRIHHSPESTH